MREHSHYLFWVLPPDGDTLALDPDESRHAVSVLRVKPGDAIFAADGEGAVYRCKVESAEAERCEARIVGKEARPPVRPAVRLFVGLPERDAFERVLEGLVPLGVAAIVPFESRFCQKRWWKGKRERQRERFIKKMTAAAKQALYPHLPVLEDVVSFGRAAESLKRPALLADSEGVPLSSLVSRFNSAETLDCVVGPPGGLAPEEVEALKARGAVRVRLSANRLRTELAAVVLAGSAAAIFGVRPATQM